MSYRTMELCLAGYSAIAALDASLILSTSESRSVCTRLFGKFKGGTEERPDLRFRTRFGSDLRP